MGNKVKFTLTDTPPNLASINAVVTNKEQDTILWSGVHATNGGDVELDIGTAGADGQNVWVYGNNAGAGSEGSANAFGGYSLIEAGANNYILEGERLKVLPFGDSLTDNGDSPANPSYSKSTQGYWVNAANISNQEFEFLEGKGVTGNTTQDLINRITDATASDADIVMLLVGTNDINQSFDLNTIESNMSSILSSIITSGKKVLLVPVPHRQSSDNFNSTIDDLNSRYAALAAGLPNDVVFSTSNSEFNAKVGNPATELDVTGDGLHPNSYGAWLIAKEVAVTLDNSFLSSSPTGRTSLVTAFDGTGGGTLFSGATGDVPLDWRLYFADPADGQGGTINQDGSYTIRTGLEAGASENRSLFRSGNITVDPDKSYFFAIDLTMLETSKMTSMSISIGGTTGGPIQSTFRFNIPMTGGTGEQVEYINNTIATLPINFGTATEVTVLVNATCDPIQQVEYTIANPRLYEI